MEPERLDDATSWTASFVRCIPASASDSDVAGAKTAAANLQTLCARLLQLPRGAVAHDGLLVQLQRAAAAAGVDELTAVANAIGFLSQTFEATAGLLGNTLVALARLPQLVQRLRGNPKLMRAIVAEVSRFDPSVQNTRRFFMADATIGGQSIRSGDAVLLLLASANRDPSVNPNPDTFDYERREPKLFTFGSGNHRCPGRTLAETIAGAATAVLLANGFRPASIVFPIAYRPSANGRIPELTIDTAAA